MSRCLPTHRALLILLTAACGGSGGSSEGEAGTGSATEGTEDDDATAADPTGDSAPTEASGDVSSEGSGTDPTSDTEDTDPTGEPLCEATQFAEAPGSWTLPPLDFPIDTAQPMTLLSDSWSCTNEQSFRYTTIDITADGVLDLVVTDACDATGAGTTAWLVYEGGASGFAEEPSTWTLPDLGLPIDTAQPMTLLSDSWSCTNEQSFRYTTVDITADGIVDLVVTDACDAQGAGATAWLVYEGGASGFAAEPSTWSLPDFGLPIDTTQPATLLSDSWSCTNEQSFRYTTLDITADGILDLVVTDACDATGAGATAWLVYPGGDAGFADEPSTWMLPELDLPIDTASPMNLLSDSWSCTNEQSFRYVTVDLTADGVLDLVVTDACDSEGAGATAWLVYEGGASGFSDEPDTWSLPTLDLPIDAAQSLTLLSDSWSCTNEQSFRYVTLDITADGALDLVVTDACDAEGAGTTAWLVYAGGDGGFASEPTAFDLPPIDFPVDTASPLTLLSDSWSCTNEQSFRYATVDLDGEGHLDLVVTDACDAEGAGLSAWLFFAGTCE